MNYEWIHDPMRTMFLTAVLSLTRITAASLVVPFLGGDMVQLPVRTSIIASIGLVLFPFISPTVPHELGPPLVLMGLFIKEAVIGFLLGFLASKIFWVAIGIGVIVDNQRGSSIAESIDPASNGQVSPLGQFMQQAVIALFYSSGGFLLFLTAMFQSYTAWPIFELYPKMTSGFVDFFLGELDDLLRLTLVLASPMLITLFVSEFGLGLINRFAPQLNVFFLAMPLKSLVALIVLVFYLPYLVDFVLTHSMGMENFPEGMESVIQ